MRLTFLLIILFFRLSIAQDSLQQGFVKYITPVTETAVVKNNIKKELHFNMEKSLFFHSRFSMLDGQETKAEFSEKGFSYKPLQADEKGFQVYRNFKTNEVFFRIPKTTPLDPVSVEDDWVEIDWKIRNNTKTILGYDCQKAIGNFRGRTYVVWFSKEIPFPYGPWKLFGLPGLILEAEDRSERFKFIAQEVCYPCKTDENIDKVIEKEHKTIKEFVKYNDYLLENVEKNFKNTLDSLKLANKIDSSIEINLDKPTTKTDIENKRRKSIEVIYEWEDKQNNPDFMNSTGIKD